MKNEMIESIIYNYWIFRLTPMRGIGEGLGGAISFPPPSPALGAVPKVNLHV